MKKASVLLAGLLASSMSMADISSADSDMHLYSATCATQEEAYKAGFDLQTNLTTMDSQHLENCLVTPGNNVHNVKVNSTKVDIEEFGSAAQEIVYRATVSVDYSYDYNDNSE